MRTWFWGGPLVYSVNGVYEVNDSASTVVTIDLRSESVDCLVRRAGGSGHRGGFKYAAHTPAAVCGWLPEQNPTSVVPESASFCFCVVSFCASLAYRNDGADRCGTARAHGLSSALRNLCVFVFFVLQRIILIFPYKKHAKTQKRTKSTIVSDTFPPF